jgi:hypothetical protein
MKSVKFGFILAHMLQNNPNNYVGYNELRKVYYRIRDKVPDVFANIDHTYISDLMERYPLMFERVDDSTENVRGPGFRRAPFSDEHFTDHAIRQNFHNNSSQGLEGEFTQEEIEKVVEAIRKN